MGNIVWGENLGRRREGFSAIELMFVMGIIAVLGSMAVIQISTARPALKADGAMRVVLGQMNQAREMAITERRYMRVEFTGTNQVSVIREDTPTTTTTLSSIPVEGGVQFTLVEGVPDTPAAFGNSSAIDFGSATTVKFAPDGTLVSQDGQTTNGTVFVAMPAVPLSVRAVTVLGSTGRVRGYRWDGRSWKVV